MKPWNYFSESFKTLFRRRRLEAEMDEEMRFHLEMEEDALVEQGLTREEARVAARRRFGRVDSLKERARDQRVGFWAEQLRVDLVQALRSLRHAWGFSLACVLTLALAIGFCTAAFSLARPVLFEPLAFPEPDRLVFVEQQNPAQGFSSLPLSYPDFDDYRTECGAFAGFGAYTFAPFSVDDGDHVERAMGGQVSAGLFPALGVPCLMGEFFSETNEREGHDDVCLLSHSFWQSHFGGAPSVLGKRLVIDGRSRAILGVMPESFAFQGGSGLSPGAAFWVPLVRRSSERERGRHSLLAIARLKPGATLAQASDELASLGRKLARLHPSTNAGVAARLSPLRAKFLDSNLRTLGWAVLASVACSLAVACSNVASLFLARAVARRKEFAVRAALGAGRLRTLQRLLCESFVVAFCAGVLGLLLAYLTLKVALAQVRETIPHWLAFGLDWRSCLFVAAISLATCLLFGLAPAWRLASGNLLAGLSETGRSSLEHPRQSRLRALLVFGQLTLASVLLCASGLLAKMVVGLQKVDPGFVVQNLYVGGVSVAGAKSLPPAALTELYRSALAELNRLPGVVAASASTCSVSSDGLAQLFHVEGAAVPASGVLPVARLRVCTPGYFGAMGIPLLAGRDFSWDDAPQNWVAIVDAGFARRYLGGADPVGRRLRWGLNPEAPVFEVIGVVGEVRYGGLDAEPQEGFYVPLRQVPFADLAVHLREAAPQASGLQTAVRAALARTDPRFAVTQLEGVADRVEHALWRKRFLTRLMAALSLFALGLSAVGVGGLVAYSVSQRWHELGVRAALGAKPGGLVWFVSREALGLVFGGLLLGLLLSVVLARLFAAQVFGASLVDPGALLLCSALLAVVSGVSCLAAAARISRMDPMAALRAE